jgi:hypothetical protein
LALCLKASLSWFKPFCNDKRKSAGRIAHATSEKGESSGAKPLLQEAQLQEAQLREA